MNAIAKGRTVTVLSFDHAAVSPFCRCKCKNCLHSNIVNGNMPAVVPFCTICSRGQSMSNERRNRAKVPSSPSPAVMQAFARNTDDPSSVFERDPVDPAELARNLSVVYKAPDVTQGQQNNARPGADRDPAPEEGRAPQVVSPPPPPQPQQAAVIAAVPAEQAPVAARPAAAQAPILRQAEAPAAPPSPPPVSASSSEQPAPPAKQPQFVNITVNLDKRHVDALNRISAMEQMRFGRKVSASEVLRHCLDFVLERVADDKVLTDSTGAGLKLGGAE